MADKERFHLTKEGLGDLFRIGAEKTAALVRQANYLQKYVKAVEIIPALEKSGAIKFPIGWSMSKKAEKLAEKPTDYIDKLAFMAKHLPGIAQGDTVTDIAKEAGRTIESSGEKIGALTKWFVGRI